MATGPPASTCALPAPRPGARSCGRFAQKSRNRARCRNTGRIRGDGSRRWSRAAWKSGRTDTNSRYRRFANPPPRRHSADKTSSRETSCQSTRDRRWSPTARRSARTSDHHWKPRPRSHVSSKSRPSCNGERFAEPDSEGDSILVLRFERSRRMMSIAATPSPAGAALPAIPIFRVTGRRIWFDSVGSGWTGAAESAPVRGRPLILPGSETRSRFLAQVSQADPGEFLVMVLDEASSHILPTNGWLQRTSVSTACRWMRRS